MEINDFSSSIFVYVSQIHWVMLGDSEKCFSFVKVNSKSEKKERMLANTPKNKTECEFWLREFSIYIDECTFFLTSNRWRAFI